MQKRQQRNSTVQLRQLPGISRTGPDASEGPIPSHSMQLLCPPSPSPAARSSSSTAVPTVAASARPHDNSSSSPWQLPHAAQRTSSGNLAIHTSCCGIGGSASRRLGIPAAQQHEISHRPCCNAPHLQQAQFPPASNPVRSSSTSSALGRNIPLQFQVPISSSPAPGTHSQHPRGSHMETPSKLQQLAEAAPDAVVTPDGYVSKQPQRLHLTSPFRRSSAAADALCHPTLLQRPNSAPSPEDTATVAAQLLLRLQQRQHNGLNGQVHQLSQAAAITPRLQQSSQQLQRLCRASRTCHTRTTAPPTPCSKQIQHGDSSCSLAQQPRCTLQQALPAPAAHHELPQPSLVQLQPSSPIGSSTAAPLRHHSLTCSKLPRSCSAVHMYSMGTGDNSSCNGPRWLLGATLRCSS